MVKINSKHKLRLASITIAITVVILLIAAGPTSAILLGISSSTGITVSGTNYFSSNNDTVTFYTYVDINYVGERVPLQNITLNITKGSWSKSCTFTPAGVDSGTGNCTDLTIALGSAGVPYGYDIGDMWGYGYSPTIGNTSFGNGYGYGYTAGQGPGYSTAELGYAVTWNITAAAAADGAYFANLSATARTKTYVSTLDTNITVDRTAPTVGSKSPGSGASTGDTTPTISVLFTEAGSGMSNSTITMEVDGTSVSYSGTGSTGITYTPSTALTSASHTVRVNGTDNAGNTVSSSWSFTVAPGGEDPTTTGGGTPTTSTPMEQFFETIIDEATGLEVEIAQIAMVKNDVMSILIDVLDTATGEVSGETHTITLKEVGTGWVVLTIASTPTDYTLTIGKPKYIDLNGDNVNDLKITLNTVKKGIADISFQKLEAGFKAARTGEVEETAPAEITAPEEPEEVEEEEPEVSVLEKLKYSTWTYVLVVLIILILVIVGYRYASTKQE